MDHIFETLVLLEEEEEEEEEGEESSQGRKSKVKGAGEILFSKP